MSAATAHVDDAMAVTLSPSVSPCGGVDSAAIYAAAPTLESPVLPIRAVEVFKKPRQRHFYIPDDEDAYDVNVLRRRLPGAHIERQHDGKLGEAGRVVRVRIGAAIPCHRFISSGATK